MGDRFGAFKGRDVIELGHSAAPAFLMFVILKVRFFWRPPPSLMMMSLFIMRQHETFLVFVLKETKICAIEYML